MDYKVYSGKKFNSLFNSDTILLKIIDEKLEHKKLNGLITGCYEVYPEDLYSTNDFIFTDNNGIISFINLGNKIYKVIIPDDAEVKIEDKYFYSTNKIELYELEEEDYYKLNDNFWAAFNGDLKVVEKYLSNLSDSDVNNFIKMAAKNEHYEIVKLLKDKFNC